MDSIEREVATSDPDDCLDQDALPEEPGYWSEWLAMAAIVVATFVHSWLSYRPLEMQFYTDTWRWLAEFHTEGAASFWKFHFGHFLPLAKVPLYLLWRVFGASPGPFQIAGIVLHCLTAAALFRFSGYFAKSIASRVAGTLFFSLCTVPWQVVQWEAAQQIGQSLLFLLLSLLSFVRHIGTASSRWMWISILCALASALSMSFGLLTLPLLPVAGFAFDEPALRAIAVRRGLIVAGSAGILFVATCVLATGQIPIYGQLSAEVTGGQGLLEKIPGVIQWTWMGASIGLVRTAFRASPLIWLCLSAAVVFSLAMKRGSMRILLLPAALLLGAYLLTGAGRIGMGLEASLTSRYQYYPLAAVALIAVWSFEGAAMWTAQARSRTLTWIWTASVFASIWYLAWVGPRHVLGASNHMAYAGDARYFIEQAVWRRTQPAVPAGMTRVGANFLLPASLYWGPYPLDNVLPLFGPEAVRPTPEGERIAATLDSRPVRVQSLLPHSALRPDGSFQWKSGEGVKRELIDPVSGRVRITLPPKTMIEIEIDPCCRRELAYTFAARGSVRSGTGLQLRLEFRTEDNREITSVSSAPIPVSLHDVVMEASGHTPEISRSVRAQFHNACWDGSTAVVEVTDVFAWRHPVFVPTEALYPKVAEPAVLSEPATAKR